MNEDIFKQAAQEAALHWEASMSEEERVEALFKEWHRNHGYGGEWRCEMISKFRSEVGVLAAFLVIGGMKQPCKNCGGDHWARTYGICLARGGHLELLKAGPMKQFDIPEEDKHENEIAARILHTLKAHFANIVDDEDDEDDDTVASASFEAALTVNAEVEAAQKKMIEDLGEIIKSQAATIVQLRADIAVLKDGMIAYEPHHAPGIFAWIGQWLRGER